MNMLEREKGKLVKQTAEGDQIFEIIPSEGELADGAKRVRDEEWQAIEGLKKANPGIFSKPKEKV